MFSPAWPDFQCPSKVSCHLRIYFFTVLRSRRVRRETEHGLFTRHLLQALNGAADRNRYGKADGSITLNEVRQYLDREMSYAARRHYGRTQQAMVFGDPDRVLVSLE